MLFTWIIRPGFLSRFQVRRGFLYHLTNACLKEGFDIEGTRASLLFKFETEKRYVTICTLSHKVPQCPLNLQLTSLDEVNGLGCGGTAPIVVSGYVVENEDEEEEDDEQDMEREDDEASEEEDDVEDKDFMPKEGSEDDGDEDESEGVPEGEDEEDVEEDEQEKEEQKEESEKEKPKEEPKKKEEEAKPAEKEQAKEEEPKLDEKEVEDAIFTHLQHKRAVSEVVGADAKKGRVEEEEDKKKATPAPRSPFPKQPAQPFPESVANAPAAAPETAAAAPALPMPAGEVTAAATPKSPKTPMGSKPATPAAGKPKTPKLATPAAPGAKTPKVGGGSPKAKTPVIGGPSGTPKEAAVAPVMMPFGKARVLPNGLSILEESVGSGQRVTPGDKIEVHVEAHRTSFDGPKVLDSDATWFVGTGSEMAGLDEGVTGMFAGSVRRLEVPEGKLQQPTLTQEQGALEPMVSVPVAPGPLCLRVTLKTISRAL